ncbi:Hypothetical predicted protein [Octopus vulgaris]|uniref:Uncharacterized protein n=1 Tax=Octopus vulgaris TaxID=6645 RepID=A0AA36BCK1_OCTVU|nr:Hypothetical predicted protein [Octopus vulgaris]
MRCSLINEAITGDYYINEFFHRREDSFFYNNNSRYLFYHGVLTVKHFTVIHLLVVGVVVDNDYVVDRK